MRISIEIDTDRPLSGIDQLVLAALATPPAKVEPTRTPLPPEAYVPEPTAEDRAADVPCMHFAGEDGMCQRCGEQLYGTQPAKDPEEKPKRKRRTKAEMEAARTAEAAAAEEPKTDVQLDDSDEDTDVDTDVGRQARDEDDEPEAAPAADEEPSTVIERFRAEAVERASALVAQGQRQKVKEALQAVGAPKVSQLPDDKLAEFLGLLKD